MIQFLITRVTDARPIRGGQIRGVNVAIGQIAATITTRCHAVGIKDILTLAHYPSTVVLYEYD